MITMVIPMRARLYLLGLINQDTGGLEDEKRCTATDLLYKLELAPGEANLYEMPLPQGGAYLHLDRIAQAADLTVDLTTPELRRAVSLLTEWKSYRPGDDRFIRPLLKDLREAIAAADAVTIDNPGAPITSLSSQKRKTANGGSQ